MKILYIITQADGGGAQKYVLTLAKHFKGIIAAGEEAEELFVQAAKHSITTYRLKHLKRNINLFSDIVALFEIRGLIKAYNPDIVHLNSSKAGFLGSLATIFLKTKVVFTAHGFIFNEPMPFWKKNLYLAFEKNDSDFRDFIITVSDADKKSALDAGLIDPKKIKTIHNGIEKINFLSHNQARKELGLPEDKKIWVTIANDYESKGLNIFESFKPASGTMIAVIGNTPKRQSSEEIKFLGPKEDASKYLKAFDGMIVPSKKEGFPYVVLESLEAGLPVIASAVGGIPEALGDAGILIEKMDGKSLAEKIEKEFLNENKAKELSQKALERSKLFTEEKMLSETKKVYEYLLK